MSMTPQYDHIRVIVNSFTLKGRYVHQVLTVGGQHIGTYESKDEAERVAERTAAAMVAGTYE